ncbi:MAG: hypothetical protein WCL08_01050 [Verrucomicrobiota bacterium]
MTPEITRVLKDYQVEPALALHRALTNGEQEWGYPGAVDLSEVGVGKSFMDLAAMLETGRKVVVLCPVVGVSGWQKAFAHFGAAPHFIGSYEAVRGGFRPDVATIHGGEFRWKNAGEIGLILDEAQAVKNQNSISSYCADGAIAQKIPMICASATLAISPLELRIAGQITGLHKGGDDWLRFMVEHGCEWSEDEQKWKWNRKPIHLDRINRLLIPQRGIRVRKADMGEQPGTTLAILPLDVPEGPQIEKEWRDALDQLDRLERQNMPFQQAMNLRRAVRTRLWKRCEMALVEEVAGRVDDDVRAGKSVVVFFSFTESRMAMGRILGVCAGFYGGQQPKARAYWQEEFQANRQHILLCNITSGGASVSLHDTTGDRPRVSYIFPTDRAVSAGQAPGRIDRSGSMTHSMQFIPCVRGTLCERMVHQTMKKLGQLQILNDGATNS